MSAREWAEAVDEFRVVPRILVLLYGYICYQTWVWFTGLPDPTTAQTTFASAIWGAAAAWFGFYVNSGRKVTTMVSMHTGNQTAEVPPPKKRMQE